MYHYHKIDINLRVMLNFGKIKKVLRDEGKLLEYLFYDSGTFMGVVVGMHLHKQIFLIIFVAEIVVNLTAYKIL